MRFFLVLLLALVVKPSIAQNSIEYLDEYKFALSNCVMSSSFGHGGKTFEFENHNYISIRKFKGEKNYHIIFSNLKKSSTGFVFQESFDDDKGAPLFFMNQEGYKVNEFFMVYKTHGTLDNQLVVSKVDFKKFRLYSTQLIVNEKLDLNTDFTDVKMSKEGNLIYVEFKKNSYLVEGLQEEPKNTIDIVTDKTKCIYKDEK